MPDWELVPGCNYYFLHGSPIPFIHRTALIGDGAELRDNWHGGDYLPRIGPKASVGAFVSIDRGIFRHTLVGARTKLMKHVHIGHDSLVGDDCELAPGAVLCGEVTVFSGVKIGAGALLRPRVTIGEGARIGIGAVVVKDVPAGETWVGNPAKQMRSKASPPEREMVNAMKVWTGAEPFEYDLEFDKPGS